MFKYCSMNKALSTLQVSTYTKRDNPTALSVIPGTSIRTG